jgi:carbon starvation protein
LDAGTRVGRYLLQDLLGNLWKPLADTRSITANVAASVLMVAGWGYFLIQGVRDPLGGINSLWPLFGIANQLLAAIALCLATTIVLKMQLNMSSKFEVQSSKFEAGKPVFMLVTLVPLVWLLAVTMTAGWEKIFDRDTRIGFLSAAKVLDEKLPALQQALASARMGGDAGAIGIAEKALANNRTLHFNNLLDAVVTGFFLCLVVMIVVISVREWILLLARKRLATLRESEPVWLREFETAESRPAHVMGMIALGFALARELSGEARLERAQQMALNCPCAEENKSEPDSACAKSRKQLYLQVTQERFNGVRRCC